MDGPSKLTLTQQAITLPGGVNPPKLLPHEVTDASTPTKTTPFLPKDLETQISETSFSSNEIYIDQKLPPEVAVLQIYQNGEDKYSVWGGNAVSRLPSTQPKEIPELSLGKLVLQKELPEDIRDGMSCFSEENIEIRNWLKKLRNDFDEQLCLIINDHTDFEIPWEMVELSPWNSSSEYIGASITTVRWQKVIREEDYLTLEVKKDKCFGSAVAYVLDTELQEIGPELDILERLQSVIYRSSTHTIEEFQTHLESNESGCGFVYISCHGNFSENLREITLGSNSDKQQQLKLLALRRCQLNLIKNSQGIVFINACHSGRHQEHPFIPQGYRRGFVELFLKKGARGVIGTLGPVGNKYAGKFARDLIHESLESSKLSVAELIRKLRLRIVENLSDMPTSEGLECLIYTFMYVYYGNPMTVLQLTPPGEKPNV